MKDYQTITIDERINKKINSLNIVRNARIAAGKRLETYEKHWQLLFLIMNILSTVALIFSLTKLEEQNKLIISSAFSLYSLIIQYYISNQNYKERALNFHYHQIKLEEFINQLQRLILEHGLDENTKMERYFDIINLYHVSLQGEENHEEVDRFCEQNRDYMSVEKFFEGKSKRYVIIDDIIIWLQWIAIPIFILIYSCLGGIQG